MRSLIVVLGPLFLVSALVTLLVTTTTGIYLIWGQNCNCNSEPTSVTLDIKNVVIAIMGFSIFALLCWGLPLQWKDTHRRNKSRKSSYDNYWRDRSSSSGSGYRSSTSGSGYRSSSWFGIVCTHIPHQIGWKTREWTRIDVEATPFLSNTTNSVSVLNPSSLREARSARRFWFHDVTAFSIFWQLACRAFNSEDIF